MWRVLVVLLLAVTPLQAQQAPRWIVRWNTDDMAGDVTPRFLTDTDLIVVDHDTLLVVPLERLSEVREIVSVPVDMGRQDRHNETVATLMGAYDRVLPLSYQSVDDKRRKLRDFFHFP